jgi:hypothetical protein
MRIDQRVSEMGSDGKLLPGSDGQVCQVNLLEKLLVPLLSKLGNLVIDGGIWLNTQRPEWNDANNALVGQGLSMVTLYYLRRYVRFLTRLLSDESGSIELSREVAQWLDATAACLGRMRRVVEEGAVGPAERHRFLVELGEVSSSYRQSIYEQGAFSRATSVEPGKVQSLLEDALAVIDHSIRGNLRDDGLFHAYNLLGVSDGAIEVDHLYPMLEGQVAALSSGFLDGAAAADLVDQLFRSDIYRPDQNTFLLYPDRSLPRFLQKNIVPTEGVLSVPLLARMLDESDHRIVARDVRGDYRFHPDLVNAQALRSALAGLVADYGDMVESSIASVLSLYESVFDHRSFTGRSGGMFGFEGLGSIYWHMVSKLLLAVQENFFSALDRDESEAVCARLGRLYYRVREGIGFNKSPQEYGAFPTDPYSHTPGHMGAQQPGMTGQVKEEIITRFGELGVRVRDGVVHFAPDLLRPREFLREPGVFRFLAVSGEWEELSVPSGGLAFTWCQVPLVYRLGAEEPSLEIIRDDGSRESMSDLALPVDLSRELFQRTGRIQRIELALPEELLFAEQT